MKAQLIRHMLLLFYFFHLFEPICSTNTKWDIVLRPVKRSIVLAGHRTNIRVYCEPELSQDIRLSITPRDPDIVRVLTRQLNISINDLEVGNQNDSTMDVDAELGLVRGHIRLLGIKPGSTRLKINILHGNRSLIARLQEDYAVTVVRRVDVLQDAFMYVLSAAQVMVLLMLGWRLRSAAVKEVLCRPCTLIAAILCQTLLMPLVRFGIVIIVVTLSKKITMYKRMCNLFHTRITDNFNKKCNICFC